MKCPGQDMQHWKPGDIFDVPCPTCGKAIEFFKDDTTRICKSCGTKVVNPRMDFGCAAYCAFAEQCLQELPPEILEQKKDLFKERVACEMRRLFSSDRKRIQHAERVAAYAERIGKEGKCDMAVLMAAAYLHDIGIHEAEKRYGSTAARYQEELGPPIARDILQRIGADQRLIDEVADIISHHHHPRTEETINFKALYDADLLVNIQEGDVEKPRYKEKLRLLIETKFFTETGKRLAGEIFLKETEDRIQESEANF